MPKQVIPTDGKLVILTTCQTNSLESISHNRQYGALALYKSLTYLLTYLLTYISINQAQFNKIRKIPSMTKNCICRSIQLPNTANIQANVNSKTFVRTKIYTQVLHTVRPLNVTVANLKLLNVSLKDFTNFKQERFFSVKQNIQLSTNIITDSKHPL